ncbi:MAG: glycosyltransferase family 2 protein [Candidatus Nanoarchaeia archaeon]|nr:glycosyltransferase family 2 protein [Candidatus Nanoarchaeia archaeon]MDD5357966.1 glycosyltransferase family 2 protein [Candidatus Nanoarchaeia archaeon]MDD5588885.1 glycosyltransferase family 2 protein [Candidatus Nanoarchaeia archaeon]
MEILSIIYLFYMFVSIYFLAFFLILYFNNKKTLFDFPATQKKYSISVLVPAYNEQATLRETIEAIFDIDYPIKEVIILNDGSTDRTREISEELLKKFPKLKLVNKENSGKGDSLNQGIKMAKGELVVVVDADSYPAKDSFGKLVGYFDDEKVGGVTCFFAPRNKNTFLEKMQVIEYNVIALVRKLLGYVDGVYVTPGPLAMYRKTALEKINGFDSKNMTEDIEIAWNLTNAGYERKMCLATNATTTVPNKWKAWYIQRRRWDIGGIQCIAKYKKEFLKKGMLGMFIIPFFVFTLFIGVLGLGVFAYLFVTKIISNYLLVTYSIPVGVPILTMEDIFITPSFLNYLGIILFFVGLAFTIMVLYTMKESILKKQNIFNIIIYSLVYLSVYPFIIISAIYNYFKRNTKWR